MENNSLEKCILCGVDTPYTFNDHIDYRTGYIEGVGQLCHSCWSSKPNAGAICIPGRDVRETPNDAHLGEKVRKIYWDKWKVTKQKNEKPFNVGLLREITDLYEEGEISYGRMVEMLNEIAIKWHTQVDISKKETTVSKTERV
jgi:hypothetical protein